MPELLDTSDIGPLGPCGVQQLHANHPLYQPYSHGQKRFFLCCNGEDQHTQ